MKSPIKTVLVKNNFISRIFSQMVGWYYGLRPLTPLRDRIRVYWQNILNRHFSDGDLPLESKKETGSQGVINKSGDQEHIWMMINQDTSDVLLAKYK